MVLTHAFESQMQRMIRRTKGAVKLHLMLDHDGLLPCYMVILHTNPQ
jgi:hypothetical protein